MNDTTCKCGKEKGWDNDMCPDCQKEKSMTKQTTKKPTKKQAVIVLPKQKPVSMISPSSADLIRMAIDKNTDLDKLEKLLIIKERFDATEAKKAYHEAMAAFKENPPEIENDKFVSYTTRSGDKVEYNHAGLANTASLIVRELSKHGLSSSWPLHQEGERISVTCKITHSKGHSEETTLSGAPDTSGGKNSIQAIGSTVKYLERYTLLAMTGLATHEQEDDGRGAGKPIEPIEFITEKQLSILVDMIQDAQAPEDKFLAMMGVEELVKIPAGKYQYAVNALKESKKKKEKK